MAIPFLRSESEENATQAIAFIGICIMTVGLTIMNVTGAIAGSEGTSGGRVIIRGALAIILSGAELLAAVALVRVMLAHNLWRKVVGSVIFIGLAWACIQNGKRAVHLIYPEFAESAVLLEAKALIAKNDADVLAAAKTAAIDATPAELEKVRTGIAKLEAEQQLMAGQSPEKIKEAQALLIAQGKYFGKVDGLREELTEAAMRSRGEELAGELDLLKRRESSLSGGVVAIAPVLQNGAADDAALKQVGLEEQARKAAAATIWLEIMLWVFEGARSFGLWALVATITARPVIKHSDEVEDGMVHLNMTQEEWDRYQAAMNVHDNIKDGAQKGARTRRRGKKIKEGAEYSRELVETFLRRRRDGEAMEDILRLRGLSLGEFTATYDKYIQNDDERELLLGEFDEAFEDEPVDEDEPSQMANGYDHTNDDEGADNADERAST